MVLRLLLRTCLCLTISATFVLVLADQTTTTSGNLTISNSTTSHTHRTFWQWLTSFFRRDKKKDEKPSYDLLIFNQAFPVPFCALKQDPWCKTSLNETQWIIRGIWPTLKNGDRVSNCSKTVYNSSALKDILPQMKEHWTNILHPNDEFWSRQWVKYGSCSLDLFKTEIEYFKQGLKWNKEWPLGIILRKKGVVPSNENEYKYKQFYDSISKAVGRTPHLKCHSYKNMSFITEVRLCFSKKLKLIDCHKNYKEKTDCPEKGISFPRTPDFYKKMYLVSNKISQQLNRTATNTTDIVKGLEQ